ncbi:MAG: hypothetical protein JWP37_673 [Mucilaginibacter sp.]|nr:hypothetical protein [Mucilaginibacter sp.]
MKTLFFTIAIVSLFSVATLKAQNKATQDDNRFITVVQTQKTLGSSHQIHYKLTNINSVAMDFTLYKESTDGHWYTTHHLNLRSGESFEEEGGFSGATGKYILYSAPNNNMADFPSFRDMASLQGQGGNSSTTGIAPTTATVTNPTAATNNPAAATPTVNPTPVNTTPPATTNSTVPPPPVPRTTKL